MKTVLITGAGTGIGKACANLFAVRGYNVAINYNKSEPAALALEKSLSGAGLPAKAFQCDITKKDEVVKMFDEINKRFGTVKVLINNSGIAEQKLFTDISEQDWDRMFDVNVKGTFLCSQMAIKQMLIKHAGSIVNISSMWGQIGASCEVHYSASKAAVIGLTKALAKEVGPSGIRVNCICPGVIETKMNSNLGQETMAELSEETPLGRLGDADDVAKAVLFLAEKDADFITGQILGVNGGFVI